MTKEEFFAKMKELEDDFKIRKDSLAKEFAVSNSPYKVGDIIQDHLHIIKVEKISGVRVYLNGKLPVCIYKGIQLTSKLKPKKHQDSDSCIVQCDVIKKLK